MDPADRARERREQIDRHLREAEQLEAKADGMLGAIGSEGNGGDPEDPLLGVSLLTCANNHRLRAVCLASGLVAPPSEPPTGGSEEEP